MKAIKKDIKIYSTNYYSVKNVLLRGQSKESDTLKKLFERASTIKKLNKKIKSNSN